MKRNIEPGTFSLSITIYVLIVVVTELFMPPETDRFIKSSLFYKAIYGGVRYAAAYWLAFFIGKHRALKKS